MMQTVADNVKSHKQAYLERWQVAIECDIWQRTGDLGEVSLSEVVQAEVWLKCLGESARTEELRNLVWSYFERCGCDEKDSFCCCFVFHFKKLSKIPWDGNCCENGTGLAPCCLVSTGFLMLKTYCSFRRMSQLDSETMRITIFFCQR